MWQWRGKNGFEFNVCWLHKSFELCACAQTEPFNYVSWEITWNFWHEFIIQMRFRAADEMLLFTQKKLYKWGCVACRMFAESPSHLAFAIRDAYLNVCDRLFVCFSLKVVCTSVWSADKICFTQKKSNFEKSKFEMENEYTNDRANETNEIRRVLRERFGNCH